MTEETNLQLNKLVESIDGVSGQLELLAENASNPDWWTIGITVVNALIMIWLGWKQYKLQEQQNKLARYDENIALYNNMKRIHWYVQYVFRNINYALENIKYHIIWI